MMKNNLLKILAISVVIAMAISLISCEKDSGETAEDNGAAKTAEAEARDNENEFVIPSDGIELPIVKP